jgi:hypothetical protein
MAVQKVFWQGNVNIKAMWNSRKIALGVGFEPGQLSRRKAMLYDENALAHCSTDSCRFGENITKNRIGYNRLHKLKKEKEGEGV